MKKVIGLLLFIILIFLIINFNNTQILILNNIDIWLKYVVVSIGPTFIISNLLYQFPFISFLLYPLLKKIMHFENQKARTYVRPRHFIPFITQNRRTLFCGFYFLFFAHNKYQNLKKDFTL
jgi:hypothetical protein